MLCALNTHLGFGHGNALVPMRRVRVRVRVGERDPNDLRIKYSFRVLA